MYVLDGEWEFNIDALQNALSPDAESVADISDYCQSRDSAYYDGGIIKASRPFSSNGIDMLRSEGRPDEIPGVRIHDLRSETGAVAHHRRDQLPRE